jgi:hypothetical protein
MATPFSPDPISLNDVQTEFGGAVPVSIDEYYKADLGVPTSGAISLNDLRGKTRHATKTEIATFFSSPGGVYRRGLNDSGDIGTPVLKYGSYLDGQDLGTRTHLFTPSAITSPVAANLKNCVENTVVWFFGGDDAANTSVAITAHQINGNGITIIPTYDTRVIGAFGSSGRTLCQFSAYHTASTAAVGTSGRLTAITQASCTFPALGGNNQQIGGAFLLPGKWTATVPYASFLTSNTPVTLDHGDICLVGWGSGGDPTDGDAPFNETLNMPLSNASGNILPNFVHAKRWSDGVTGFLFYANLSGSTRTYTLPTTITYGNTHSLFKHYMILKFAPNQYLGQQS